MNNSSQQDPVSRKQSLSWSSKNGKNFLFLKKRKDKKKKKRICPWLHVWIPLILQKSPPPKSLPGALFNGNVPSLLFWNSMYLPSSLGHLPEWSGLLTRLLPEWSGLCSNKEKVGPHLPSCSGPSPNPSLPRWSEHPRPSASPGWTPRAYGLQDDNETLPNRLWSLDGCFLAELLGNESGWCAFYMVFHFIPTVLLNRWYHHLVSRLGNGGIQDHLVSSNLRIFFIYMCNSFFKFVGRGGSCWAQVFSSWGGYSLVVEHRLSTVAASLATEHRL